MKLLLTLLMALPALSYGQAGIQDVHEVAKSTQTITQTFTVGIGSIAVAQSATSSGSLNGSFAVEVYNPIGNSTLNVGFDVSLSTNINSPFYGREVAAGTGVYYATPSGNRPLYIKSQSTSAVQKVTVTQFK